MKKITVPEPFNLTKIKPKKILEPIKMSTKVELKDVPYEQFQKTSLNKLEDEAKTRKEGIQEVKIKVNNRELKKSTKKQSSSSLKLISDPQIKTK